MFEPRAEAQESVEEVLPPPDPSPDSLLPLGVTKLTDIWQKSQNTCQKGGIGQN